MALNEGTDFLVCSALRLGLLRCMVRGDALGIYCCAAALARDDIREEILHEFGSAERVDRFAARSPMVELGDWSPDGTLLRLLLENLDEILAFVLKILGAVL